MVWAVLIAVAVLLVGVTVAAVLGRVTPELMGDPGTTTPHHGLDPDGDASSIGQVRFDTALRGYRMDQVDEVVEQLRERIARLEGRASAGADDDGRRSDDRPV